MAYNRQSQANRRTVLKSLAGGAGAFFGTTANVLGSAGDRTEVVMEWQGKNEPYVTRKVPRRWKQHMDKTERLTAELSDQYRDNEDIFSFMRVRGDVNRGGKAAPQLGARVREGSSAKSLLPNNYDGVPIEVKEVENNEAIALSDLACENNTKMDKIKGGVLIRATDGGESDWVDVTGTSMTPAYKKDSDYHVMLTANHLFSEDTSLFGTVEFPCDPNWKDGAYQHNSEAGQYIGDVTKYAEAMDYAMLRLNHQMDPEYTVPHTRWTWPHNIVTYVSSYRLGELVQEDTEVDKMGVTTGGTTGEIQSDSEDVTIDCLDMENKGFQCSANIAKGDSGGPVYRPSLSGDGLAMIGLASGTRRNKFDSVGWSCNDKRIYASFFGPPAWDMANRWDLRFSP